MNKLLLTIFAACCLQSGQLASAAGLSGTAGDLDKLYGLACKLFSSGRYEGSAVVCKKLITMSPQDRRAYLLLIQIAEKNNDPEKALSVAKEALKKLPADPEIVYKAACVFDRSGQLSESNSLYEKAYELNSSGAAQIMGRTRALARSGKSLQAKQFALAQAQKFKTNPDLYDCLLESSIDCGDAKSACYAMNEIYRLLIAGKKLQLTSADLLTNACWRVIGMDQWSTAPYAASMKILVVLNKNLEAISLVDLCSRKFQTDPAIYAAFAKAIKDAESLQQAQGSLKVWNAIDKLCKSQERTAKKLLATEKQLTLSAKKGGTL